jgi:hypothetical protein
LKKNRSIVLPDIQILNKEEFPEDKNGTQFYVQTTFIFDYISQYYKDYGVTKTAVSNMLKYGFLRDHCETIKNIIYVLNNQIDNIFSTNIISLDTDDFFKSLVFGIKMLEKVENFHPRFGTFYDKIAKRNGTALNYLERHMVGKLGETGTVKYINNLLKQSGSKLEVENSFDTTQVESADIVFVRNSKSKVLVNAGKRIQIKCSSGLNGVILKEDKYKLDSETFNVDYCAFAQLLNSPFVFLIDYLTKLAHKFIDGIGSDEILANIAKEIDKDLLKPTVKLCGYIARSKMKIIEKGKTLTPLGEVSSDSYYAYVADLETDYSTLAQELISVNT